MENADFIQKGESGTVHVSNPDSGVYNKRIFSTAGGAFLTILGLRRGGLLGMIAAAAGGALVYKGISGKWPMDSSDTTDVDITTSLIINESRELLYAYWRNLENLSNFMRHLESVEELTKTKSKWAARIPGGLGKLEWEAEIIREEKDSLLVWRSLPGSEIQNSGEVRFQDVPGKGTRVKARISYRPPAGELGELAAKMFNPAFREIITDDLERFKDFIETGNFNNPGYDLWEGRDPGRF